MPYYAQGRRYSQQIESSYYTNSAGIAGIKILKVVPLLTLLVTEIVPPQR
ncbi:MAG: hypothetical protein AAGA16_20655 [Cyanobacteria bacterium P01_E01_bin.35]